MLYLFKHYALIDIPKACATLFFSFFNKLQVMSNSCRLDSRPSHTDARTPESVTLTIRNLDQSNLSTRKVLLEGQLDLKQKMSTRNDMRKILFIFNNHSIRTNLHTTLQKNQATRKLLYWISWKNDFI